MNPIKQYATYVIDTSNIKVMSLKERISKLFLGESDSAMVVHCMSFGFKHGIPMETDLIFDVRCLPNPFYEDELKYLTGLDKPVNDYVLGNPDTKGLVKRIIDLLDYTIPMYQKEGKSQLVIAVGCTGGHHRSVAISDYIYKFIEGKKIKTSITHRDITK